MEKRSLWLDAGTLMMLLQRIKVSLVYKWLSKDMSCPSPNYVSDCFSVCYYYSFCLNCIAQSCLTRSVIFINTFVYVICILHYCFLIKVYLCWSFHVCHQFLSIAIVLISLIMVIDFISWLYTYECWVLRVTVPRLSLLVGSAYKSLFTWVLPNYLID